MTLMDINALLSGSFTFCHKADPDLKKIVGEGSDYRGGYRILNPGLFDFVLREECRGILTDYRGESVEIGVVQSDLQTPNYRLNGRAPFPSDATLVYGKVQFDRKDDLRIWPGALVLGDLSVYDSCALKWRDSGRYLLVPYTANVYNMVSYCWSFKNDKDEYYRNAYRIVYPNGSVRQCLGSIKSGGLEAVAYNNDLMAGYQPLYNVLPPVGFLPVFSAERPGNSLAEAQDLELGLFLAQFMPEADDAYSVQKILEQEIPGIAELTEAYRASGKIADLPEGYAEDGTSQKVYETYIKVLAKTYIESYQAGENE